MKYTSSPNFVLTDTLSSCKDIYYVNKLDFVDLRVTVCNFDNFDHTREGYVPSFIPYLRSMDDLTKPLPSGVIPIIKCADMLGYNIRQYKQDGCTYYGWDYPSEGDKYSRYHIVWDKKRKCFSIYDNADNTEGHEIESHKLNAEILDYLYDNLFNVDDIECLDYNSLTDNYGK